MKAWINGQLVDEEKATLSIFDRSYLYGEGIFETLRCYGGRPAFFDRHYQRLLKNCGRLEIAFSHSESELLTACHKLLEVNQIKEGVLRFTVSTVGAAFGVDRPKNPPLNVTLFCKPISLDPKFFETGVRLLPLTNLVNDSREIAGIKSTSYLTKMLARALASKEKAYESLLKNFSGDWAEGSRTNFFIVLDRAVITPPLRDGILNGITREVALEILKEKKIPHREDHVTDTLLKNADEIFLTGSTSEVMPVNEVIGIWKKETSKDSLTRTVQTEYQKRLIQ